jgi:ferredoxin
MAVGQCVLDAPGVFEQEPDTGLVILLADASGAADDARVLAAVANCPSGAITLVEEGGEAA